MASLDNNPNAAPDRDMLDIRKRFRAYRGEPVQTDQQILDLCRLTDYINPNAVAAPAPGVNPLPPRPQRIAPPVDPDPDETRRFLSMDLEDLEDPQRRILFGGGAGRWSGSKILGQGGNGRVGLWEFQPANRLPGQIYLQVAVKETTTDGPEGSLDDDNKFLRQLRESGSPHINHSLVNGRGVDAAAENLDMRWDGLIRILIMEYCSLGDLSGLLTTFQRLGRPLREITVWKLFECMVDGLSVLEYGNELTLRSPENSYRATIRENWDPIVHFDLKPENILLGVDKAVHGTSPVYKIGDFGSAENISSFDGPHEWKRRFAKRDRTTDGYFAPEQFSATWEARDYKASSVAGKYTFKTNIWGIGCIMYQIMLLSDETPDPRTPFTPSFAATWVVNGTPPAGRTYGNALRGGLPVTSQSPVYSNELIDLVQLCLMEVPDDRPSLIVLRERIRLGINDVAQAGGIGASPEYWNYFTPAPLPLAGGRALCMAREADGSPCKNLAIAQGYCTRHQSKRLNPPVRRARGRGRGRRRP
ncbi:kinase-like protein [Stipitochalara longipes BDJ]|nr:kinase-like protein [Stipitochalara longipes BDJ]